MCGMWRNPIYKYLFICIGFFISFSLFISDVFDRILKCRNAILYSDTVWHLSPTSAIMKQPSDALGISPCITLPEPQRSPPQSAWGFYFTALRSWARDVLGGPMCGPPRPLPWCTKTRSYLAWHSETRSRIWSSDWMFPKESGNDTFLRQYHTCAWISEILSTFSSPTVSLNRTVRVG